MNPPLTPPIDTVPEKSLHSASLKLPSGGQLWQRLAREPLLHFLLIGALVFGADQLIAARRGDPQTIVVSADVRKESTEVFKNGMKREPSPADLKILIDRWVDNEVLYREGLALGLDRGDSSIRERIIFKALSVTQSSLNLPKVDRETLRQWFAARHARYDEPARVNFLEAVVSIERTPAALAPFVDALNGRGKSDVESSLRVFKDRPRGNLVQGYGEEFTAALEQSNPAQWQSLPSSDGLRVVRLEQLVPAVPARFEVIEERVYRDWKDDTMAELTTQAVRDMGKKYRVRDAGAGQ